MNIDEEIAKLQHLRNELKSDLDDILDTINSITIRRKEKGLTPQNIKKIDKILETYKELFYNYSSLLNNNDKSLRQAGNLKKEIT